MFNWGIMGGGFISSQFAKGLEAVPDMRVEALASRSGRNDRGISAANYYADYNEMLKNDRIDAVYIGTIHPQHLECAKLCLEAGKAVLCEKPVTLNSGELEEILELADRKQLFFMEAMWTRFIPLMRQLRQDIQDDVYGKVHNIHITFGGPAAPTTRRLWEARLGGGALLDVGVYGINVAEYLLGEAASEIHAWADLTGENIDKDICIQMKYPSGCLADMVFSITRKVDSRAVLITDKAELEIPYFWRPDTMYRFSPNADFRTDTLEEKKVVPVVGNGYNYEAQEVRRMLETGRIQSPVMSWEDSRSIMSQLDQIRKICGIVYPQDQKGREPHNS